MKRNAGLRTAVMLAMAAVLLPVAPTHACGYDGLISDLTAAHPRSIEVALAVRDALDHKELRALAPVPPVLGLMRANGMLQRFRPLVASVAGFSNASSASIAVLLIEAGLWSRYSITASGVVVELHISGPQEGEPVVVTSEAALRALLDGELTPARASELGVLVVDRPGQIQTAGRSDGRGEKGY